MAGPAALQPLLTAGSGREGRVGFGARLARPPGSTDLRSRALNTPPPLSPGPAAAVPAPGRISALCEGATRCEWQQAGRNGRSPGFNPAGVHVNLASKL